MFRQSWFSATLSIVKRSLPEKAALLALVHEREEPQLLVKELTDLVNTALRAGGEFSQFSPEEVGHWLAALAYTGVGRQRGGW